MDDTVNELKIINENTKKIQKVLVNTLAEFTRLCNKLSLRYYLIDGLLLGAVRHQGFIPWDDDIDVGMPRSDYEKLCRVAPKMLPHNMYIVTYEESIKEGSIAEIARIYCTDIQLKMDYFKEDRISDVWMDIMIMDGMPSNSCLRWLHYKRIYIAKAIARMGRIRHIGKRTYSLLEKR